MANVNYISKSSPISFIKLNGGLNSTGGALGLDNNESSDLLNIDFDKFGSIVKRNGYSTLNGTAIANDPRSDGLHWFEFESSGTITRMAVNIADGKFHKMDDLDGTWDDVSGTVSITAENHCDFESFLNTVFVANGTDKPFLYTGAGVAENMVVPLNLTTAKYVAQFNNYLFLANCTVDGTVHHSRIYWSALKDTDSWDSSDNIDVSKNDGQEITGIRVLEDRLVIYKERSIYNLFFTGDSDVPFILPDGGKSSSPVGCVAPFSIQEAKNGHVFLSYDGIYFYDGSSSFKLSERITNTLLTSLRADKFTNARSLVQRNKNRYWLALTASGQTNNDRVIVWDYFNNAFSMYDGMAPSSLAVFYVSGVDERPYFGDYSGFVYRADTGTDDDPLGTTTAIDAYYYTNWINLEELISQKLIEHVYIYYQIASATITLSYSYDFESADTYSQSFSSGTSSDVYGSAVWGTATYAGAGGSVTRRDLDGRGRVVRFKFANSNLGESMQIYGFGLLANLETHV